MSRRAFRTAASLIVLPLLVAGCAGNGAETGAERPGTAGTAARDGARTPPPVRSVPVLDSANDKPLPLDPYLVNPGQFTALNQAYAKSLARCMARFGFDHVPPLESPGPRDSDAPVTRMDGRYGSQNARLMATWGYHPEGGIPAEGASSAAPTRPVSPEMVAAGRGTSDPQKAFGPGGQVVNGRTVPYHGCMGESFKELTGSADGALYDPQIAIDLKMRTLNESQQDGRTRAVFAEWSRCMRSRGFAYADPLAAGGDPAWRRTPRPTARELRVATADAACRHEHNVVGVWYAVDHAYQEKALAENAAAMAEVRKGLEFRMRAANALLQGERP
ncbi:hypothetical protein [Streptomyces hydrogenans]